MDNPTNPGTIRPGLERTYKDLKPNCVVLWSMGNVGLERTYKDLKRG